MNCTKSKCLASVHWFGHSDDPALSEFAKSKGWRVLEGKGWRCPRHIARKEAS